MKVRITFPQIVITATEVEMTEDEYIDLKEKCQEDQVDYVWNEVMTQDERDWIANKKLVYSAYDSDFCQIKKVS